MTGAKTTSTVFLLATCCFSIFTQLACGGRSPSTTSPSSPGALPIPPVDCRDPYGNHAVFHITVDGVDVGREVRTDFIKEGDNGPERIFISHLVKNERMGNILFPSTLVKTELTSKATGVLRSADVFQKNQINTNRIHISKQGSKWIRSIFSSGTYSSKSSDSDSVLPLNDNIVVGFRLYDTLSQIATGKLPSPQTFSFFDSLHNAPFDIAVSAPSSDRLSLFGEEIMGHWVEVTKLENQKVVVRAFFDTSGMLWFEDYPEIHESRRRATGQFSLPNETSELIVGLRSDTYLYDPNNASRATYHLISSPDRLEALTLLDEPLNQTLDRASPDKYILTVHAGSPDRGDSPRDADLSTSMYIKPKNPKIVQAYHYLRSAGKRGHLDDTRRLNATPVIARASLIQKPKAFWADNDKVAGLMMRYVSALLPDKRHTFSMADAVTTLANGGGDCTEHAVLFASFMRAHGIPTRLVTGMFLTQGGLWAYHMWATYWDGSDWQSIDPSTMTYRTGALHVALGRGASVFSDIRDRLADFMWRTFSGVSFNLVEAANEGESLFLARPMQHHRNLGETALFNAVVMSDLGDHLGALKLLDDNISADSRSLTVKCMRAELLANADRCDDALELIAALRQETSAKANTSLLDKLELNCLLKQRAFDRVEAIYSRVDSLISDNPSERTVLKARYHSAKGDWDEALSLLNESLLKHPDNAILLSSFADIVSRYDDASEALLSQALDRAWHALVIMGFSDPDLLASFSKLLSRTHSDSHAVWFLDHALILSPNDKNLRALRRNMSSSYSCLDSFSSSDR